MKVRFLHSDSVWFDVHQGISKCQLPVCPLIFDANVLNLKFISNLFNSWPGSGLAIFNPVYIWLGETTSGAGEGGGDPDPRFDAALRINRRFHVHFHFKPLSLNPRFVLGPAEMRVRNLYYLSWKIRKYFLP